jgi:phosphopantetheinyl transferase
VGVDLESLDSLRQPELMIDSLAPAERPLVQGLQGAALGERLLRLWCAKEAAAKCLGLGLQGQPSNYVVSPLDERFECLRVQHAAGTVEARVLRRDDTLIAVAEPALSPVAVQ